VAPVVSFMGELPASAAAIAVIETRNEVQQPGLITPLEIQFQLGEPISTSDALRAAVEGVQALPGVVAVKSDGVHVLVQYDDSRVQPNQLRQRLMELGHAAAPGVDAPAPGAAAD
jgi:hypothetical protein